MIAKLEVRKMLGAYGEQLKKEIRAIEQEIGKLDNEASISSRFDKLWSSSVERAELVERLHTLRKVYGEITDLRCAEILED